MVGTYMTANPVVPAPPGARCAEHPERDAEVVCARCGGFVCAGCVVSGDLCAPCKRRLLKDGVPWTPQEKARAEARRLGRRAELAMRAELGLCVTGALLGAAVGTGLPGVALASTRPCIGPYVGASPIEAGMAGIYRVPGGYVH